MWVYQEGYLKYGCTSTVVNGECHPKIVFYPEISGNDNTKPSQLRHLKTKYSEHEDNPLQFFQQCLKFCDTQSSTSQSFTKLNDRSLESSYHWGNM